MESDTADRELVLTRVTFDVTDEPKLREALGKAEPDGLIEAVEGATSISGQLLAGDDYRLSLYNDRGGSFDGTILNRHRKLMPTNPERMVWGTGDARGLRALDTPIGRVGALICWENYMPLARYTLYAEGVQIYVASTWDEGEGWLATMRHIASEGRCWVLGSGCALNSDDVPPTLPARDSLYPNGDTWLNSGDSVIIDPHGQVVAGPLHREYGILYADIDPAVSASAHRTMDVAGHENNVLDPMAANGFQ